MKTDSTAMQTDVQNWASKVLDIQETADATPKTDRLSHVLRMVTQSHFVVSIDEANAAQIVAGSMRPACSSPMVNESISLWRNEQGSRAVAEFKAVFFDLTIEERSRRWRMLVDQYADQPDLSLQLNQLLRGMQITMPADSMDSRQQYILRTCRNVFLSSPSVAAHLRRVFCNQWQCDETWEDAIDEALENYGDILQQLAPWIDEFGDKRFWESQDNRPYRTLKLIDSSLASSDDGSSLHRQSKIIPYPPEELVVHRAPTLGDWAGTIWIGITVLVVVTTIVLFLFEGISAIPPHSHPERPFPLKPNVHLR